MLSRSAPYESGGTWQPVLLFPFSYVVHSKPHDVVKICPLRVRRDLATCAALPLLLCCPQ